MTNFFAEITPLELFAALASVSMALGLGWTVGVKLLDVISSTVTAFIVICLIIFKTVKNSISSRSVG